MLHSTLKRVNDQVVQWTFLVQHLRGESDGDYRLREC